MRLLRNPEVRFPLMGMLASAGLCLGALAFLLRGTSYRGVVLGVTGGAFALCCAAFLISSAVHAKKVRAFTVKAERNLSGRRELQFDDFKEGDFSILQGVVKDMAIAYAKKVDQLKEEKELLKQSSADITHQLKTQMFPLTLAAEQLMADEVSPADRKRAGRKILDTADHISKLITTLLRLARLDAGAVEFHIEGFTAEKLIEHVCEPLELSMEIRDITLEKNVPPEITLQSDLFWLSEALTNIVKNCMEHTPAGGTVRIDVTDDAVRTLIVIRDTGSGIAKEDMPHLFERFYRGKDAGDNSVGIGLPFARQIVRSLYGNVEDPQNGQDGGAIFTVRMEKMNV